MTTKPSTPEDEYFFRLDQELLKAQGERLDAEREATARQAHHMKCPKCGHDLVEREFHHLKVDRCGACAGLWLDAGEAEMLLHLEDRSAGGFLRALFGGK